MSEHTHLCPTCQQPTHWALPCKPFCSQRCRLIDLGQWASEGHRILSQEAPDPHEHEEDPKAFQ